MGWIRRVASVTFAGLMATAPVSFVFVVSEQEPLKQEVRREVYDQIKDYPGLHLSQIAREVDLTTNHVKYHLRVLEENDLVTSYRQDGYWRFFAKGNGTAFPQETIDHNDKGTISLLRKPVPLKITLHLLEVSEANNKEIAEAVDVAPSTAHYHLNTMQEEGITEERRDGRSVQHQLTEPDRLREIVREHKPPDALLEGFLEAWDPVEL